MSRGNNWLDLTRRQRDVLQFIIDSLRESHFSPTVREIADHFHLSAVYSVQRHLLELEQKGYIRRHSRENPGKRAGARTLTLSPSVLQSLQGTQGVLPVDSVRPLKATLVPLLGKVAAGIPITAEQNIDEEIALPDAWTRGRNNVYLLRVQGNSMAPGIEDGDLVIVEERPNSENGSLVVACIDGEATVKRFFRERKHVILRPDNPTYPDIVLTQDFQLNGRVIGVVRLFR